MTRPSLGKRVVLGCVSLICLGGAQAAGLVVEKTLDVDLTSKIEASMAQRERFAVDVPHVVSTVTAGVWERSQGTSVWRYSVRIPSAVSLSFHADRFHLPEGATLTITNGLGARVRYVSAAGSASDLWSRVSRGDALFFELSVPQLQEAVVEFSLASLQAGYRTFGGGPNHPQFDKLRKAQAIALDCIENFACHLTPENTRNAGATAAVVIGGVALCSATLVNNLRNDGTPYLLTARHCQAGPASSVTVYWDAMTPCGQTLGTVYDTQTPAFTNYGPQTVFEQQDVWMLNLGAPVGSAQAYFAGWDVTGGTFVGGYSPHHAMGRARQYVSWTGQAAFVQFPRSVLGVGYDSDFWGVVNGVGSVGSGASGGGLFSPDHRLVGVASLAYLQNGSGSDGVCPVSPAPVPDADSSAALYTALSAVWETNADTTSFTNPITLKSLLDPDNTGRRSSDGYQLLTNMTITRSAEVATTGWQEGLVWNAPGATSCTATGGTPGDGWAGSKAANGSLLIVQYDPSVATYTLRCSNGSSYAERSVQIAWVHGAPFVELRRDGFQSLDVIASGMRLEWRSNVRPCVATGGGIGDGWPGPKTPVTQGTQDIAFTEAGTITWSITCGSGTRTLTKSHTQEIVPVAVELRPPATNMRVNQPVPMIIPTVWGQSCTRTGGAPGDNWPGPQSLLNLTSNYTSAVPGTFTYTLTCTSGSHTASDSVDLTFTNDTPVATLSASVASSHVLPPDPSTTFPHPNAVQFSWTSNMAPCRLGYDGPGVEDAEVFLGAREGYAIDSVYDLRRVAGT